MENKNERRDIWIVAAAVAIFSLLKIFSLHYRFGDENVYFYMSNAVLHGALPYKDFFLADPPFFIYLMAGFKAIFGSHLILFKILPVLLDSLSSVLLYLILRNKNSFAVLGPIFYLFSFTVLSTSDYVTGAEVMIFFVLLGIYLDRREKYYYSGVAWALACVSKLYAGPALLGFMFYKVLTKDFKSLQKIILGGLAASIVVLLPFLFLAPRQTLYDLIIHQLQRPAGINKWNIMRVFISFEWLFLIAATIGAFVSKNKKFVFPLIFSAIFFLIYRDLYYLYLHLLLPFVVILAVETVEFLNKRKEEFAWSFIVLYICIALYALFGYTNTYKQEGIFENPQEIAAALKAVPENLPVYGAQEVAPLVALMSGRKIFDNVIDTNTQNFAAGTHNLKLISENAAQVGIYLVARTAEYPDQNIHNTGFEGYFDEGGEGIEVHRFRRSVKSLATHRPAAVSLRERSQRKTEFKRVF